MALVYDPLIDPHYRTCCPYSDVTEIDLKLSPVWQGRQKPVIANRLRSHKWRLILRLLNTIQGEH
jgi:hypothetical protein